MRRRQAWLAGCLAASAIGGAWVVTNRPEPATTIRVQAPSQPAAPRPAGLTDPTASATPLSIDELIRRVTDNLAVRPMCEAAPVELTEEQQQAIQRTLSTLPIPPTVPGDAPGAVSNVQRMLVPC